MTDSFASEKPAPPSTVLNETGQSPKGLVGGVDVFEAFRSDMTKKPQWSELPAAQTAMKALTALSDSPSVSDHMGGHDDDQYYAEETAVVDAAVDETTVDETAVDETAADETTIGETAVDETAQLQDVDDAPSHAPNVGVAGVNQRAYNVRMRTRRLDVAI